MALGRYRHFDGARDSVHSGIRSSGGKRKRSSGHTSRTHRVTLPKELQRDVLYRERSSQRYVDMRYWVSVEARREALEDPEVHTFWARLGHLIKIEKIHETFERL